MAPWTEERRQKQAEAIRRWKPWEKSTGPRTEAGKERSKLNGWCGASLAAEKELLALNRVFMAQWKVCEEVKARRDRKRELLKPRSDQGDDEFA